jgi:hypothetical protein
MNSSSSIEMPKRVFEDFAMNASEFESKREAGDDEKLDPHSLGLVR